MASSSKNLFLAAIIAVSVYVPFETVAKISLLVAVFLFVVDPIPPYSRLIAIFSCWIVLKLNAYHRDFIIKGQHEQEQASIEIAATATETAGAAAAIDTAGDNDEDKKDR